MVEAHNICIHSIMVEYMKIWVFTNYNLEGIIYEHNVLKLAKVILHAMLPESISYLGTRRG